MEGPNRYERYKESKKNFQRYYKEGELLSAIAHGLKAVKRLGKEERLELDPHRKRVLHKELLELRKNVGSVFYNFGVEEDLVTKAMSLELCMELTAEIPVENVIIHEDRGLGAAGQASVFECTYLGATCAIKKYTNSSMLNNKEMKESLFRCIKSALTLNHPNILRYYGYIHMCDPKRNQQETYGIVMDKADTDLKHVIIQKGEHSLSMKEKKSLVMDILAGLVYLHDTGIIHCDLKPDNVLLVHRPTTLYRAILCDFGISIIKEHRNYSSRVQYNQNSSTPPYASPEFFINGKVDNKSDMYSFASTAYYIYTGNPPIRSKNRGTIETIIKRGQIPTPDSTDPFWNTIFNRCWVFEQEKRPTAKELYTILSGLM